MPRYIYENENGEQFEFESDGELEIEEEESEESEDEESEDEESDDEESDEDESEHESDGDGDDSDDDEESNKDTPEQYARVEEFYNAERAAIRRITEATELRLKRQSYENALQTPNPSQIGLMRVRDLLRLVEQRELDLRAKRLADRKR